MKDEVVAHSEGYDSDAGLLTENSPYRADHEPSEVELLPSRHQSSEFTTITRSTQTIRVLLRSI